jgi:Flp pilus assembly protein TadD
VTYGTRAWNAALAAAIAALGLALYLPVLDAPFIFDDLPHIAGNPGIRDLGDPASIVSGGFQETRPLFMLGVALNWAIGGDDPTGYHGVNLALHAACVALVFFAAVAIRRDLGERLPGFPEIAALVFAVHPLASESVAYVSARPGLMVAALGLASLLLFLRACDRGSRGALIAAVIASALAMASKESAVVIPPLIAAYLILVRHRGDWRAAWRAHRARLAPLALTMAIVGVLLVLADNPHDDSIGGVRLAILEHYRIQPAVIARMLRLAILPVGQSFDHAPPGGGALVAIASLAAIVGMLALGFALRRRSPVIALGIVWFFVALAPTNPGIPFPNFIAERYLYFSLFGVAIAAGWCAATVIRRGRRAALVAGLVAAAAIGGCAFLSLERARLYDRPIDLWRATVEASPDNPRPRVNLGILLAQQGDLAAAAAQLDRAIELAPNDAYARFNAGVLDERRGDLEAAAASFRAAIAAVDRPRYRISLARALNALGKRAFRAGDLPRAESLLREAVAAAASGYGSPAFNLGVVLERTGRPAEAEAMYRRALEIDPDHPGARRKLGHQ